MINYVCSLGEKCHTATFLKRMNLKVVSYPFDWVFSGINIILNCIENDFKLFLDKSYYHDVENKIFDKQCGHRLYHPSFFNHKDPREKNDYEYYERCVSRFKNLLNYTEHKLFIMMFLNMETIDEKIKKSVIDFNNKFAKYTTNYTLLVIFHLPNKHYQYNNFTYVYNIHFLELHTFSESYGTIFAYINDDIYLDSIISNKYNFKIKY